jgi:DNA polymerase-3 subunit alpha
MAVPVHNHSEYSALDGYSKPTEIADRIAELGMPGAFLTDHGTVAGLSAFRKAMEERDLFVGYGMEAYQAQFGRGHKSPPGSETPFKRGQDSFHLILLASSQEGYRNLLRISDAANRSGFYYYPRVDLELLKAYNEGIFVTTACQGSLVSGQIRDGGPVTALDDLIRIFGDRVLVEVHTYGTEEQVALNKTLASIAQDKSLRLIYANDAHYARIEEYPMHEKLICAQFGELYGHPKNENYVSFINEDGKMHHPPCLYIMEEQDVRDILGWAGDGLTERQIDEAIATSEWLMEQCRFDIDKPTQHLPKYDTGEDRSAKDLLIDLVEIGLEERYKGTQYEEEAIKRAAYELDAIIKAGLHDYFLIVWDYVQYALENGRFVGPGRGSVGGSIIAYALDITSICPLRYGLQFERFWNPGRAEGLPDIDIDFAQSDRQFMISYVKQKYGENRVMPISNHVFMRPNMALRRAARVMYENPPYWALDNISKIIKGTNDAGQVKPWDEMWKFLEEEANVSNQPNPLQEYVDQFPEMFELAEQLAGRISTYSEHASAVVIGDVDLHEYLPARATGDTIGKNPKPVVTQAEMKEVEKAGFPKFDFLGLRNLDTIMRAALLSGEFHREEQSELEERKRIVHYFRHEIDWDNEPESMWIQFDRGYTLGLFQIEESYPPRQICKRLKPRSIDDLALVVALNRPGPLRSRDENDRSIVDKFLDRHEGLETPDYPHEILEQILGSTYGLFVYQENVIAYFREVGYSPSDADHIRKILGKKLVEEMKAEYPTYKQYAVKLMAEQVAESIWQQIEDFSKYSFNKAHSVGYGMITGWTAHAKDKWDAKFVMASIETVDDTDKVVSWVHESRRLGKPILGPNILRSNQYVSNIGGSILYGLMNIKGIGKVQSSWIIEHRQKWEKIEDFLRDCTDGKVVNKGHIKKLNDAGTLDGAFHTRVQICHICDGNERYRPEGAKPRSRLIDCPYCFCGWQPQDIPSLQEKTVLERDLLGIELTDIYEELVKLHQEEIEDLGLIGDATIPGKSTVEVPGIVTSAVRGVTKTGHNKGSAYYKLQLYWRGEFLRLFVWGDKLGKHQGYANVCKEGILAKWKLQQTVKGEPKFKSAYIYGQVVQEG